MKSILNFRAGALVLGLALAFAGSGFTSDNDSLVRNSYWFSTTESGMPQQPLKEEPDCDARSGDVCAKLYESTDIVFDGNGDPQSVLPGHENNQIEIRLKD